MRAVVGHQDARQLLCRAVASGQVSHAYLLTGPVQIGKTTLARGFAQLLECEQPDVAAGLPCGECTACRKVSHGTHPDVTLVQAAEGKRFISVDDVREAIKYANQSPSEGRWRVFIFRNVEQMNASSVNALLKTLEEPPPQVVLLLTSAEPETLLPTLLSRCQVLALHPLALAEVESALVERWGVAPAEARELSALANGRLGWAVRAHERPALREERTRLLDELAGLTLAGRAERLKAAGTLASDTESARTALALWMLWWRDVTLAACGATHLLGAGAARREAERQGRLLSPDLAHAFLRALLAAQAALDQNANPRLTFDVLMLDLPRLAAAAR
ncbi:MAG TPA: DNA polymerase III subunit delta' [Ktedonobacterales bacterium]|nr:DNA polymerase III subunit delta' [Ktedonobacterales bacterium]